jgi:hypothetical protein
METTYTVLGADGAQYGPITLDQIKIWIGEGRITPETQVLRSDTNSWLQAGQYVELGLSSAPPVMATATATPPGFVPAARNPELERQIKTGADWFFWIAGLSLINTVMHVTGAGFRFYFGLGFTQVTDEFVTKGGSIGSTLGMALSVLIAGSFILFGVFARKRQTWGFIAGLVLYGLDGVLLILLSLLAGEGGLMLSIGLHGYAFYRIFMGMRANSELNALERGVVPVPR